MIRLRILYTFTIYMATSLIQPMPVEEVRDKGTVRVNWFTGKITIEKP
jgi:hypothetical protein